MVQDIKKHRYNYINIQNYSIYNVHMYTFSIVHLSHSFHKILFSRNLICVQMYAFIIRLINIHHTPSMKHMLQCIIVFLNYGYTNVKSIWINIRLILLCVGRLTCLGTWQYYYNCAHVYMLISLQWCTCEYCYNLVHMWYSYMAVHLSGILKTFIHM